MTSDMRIAATQQFFQRSLRGEVASAMELLDEEVSLDVPGSHQLSGHFEGPEAIAQHLGKLLRLTNRTANVLQWEDWMAGINHVAALAHLRVQRPGAIHTFRAIYLIEVTDHTKIGRIEMFFDDQAAVERFFSVVIG